jgi:prophage tail gpP-like protein
MTLVRVQVGNPLEDLTVSAVTVTRSLETADSGARVQTFEDRADAIGEPIAIDMEGVRLLTGTVEQWPGSRERGFGPTARSTTVQLGLFDALQSERPRETTVAAIARVLAQRAGVSVVAVADEPVDRFKIARGQSYQRAIQGLCEVHGFVLTSDALGRAVLFRAPRERTPIEIWELGRAPVRDMTINRNIQDWRDEIVCRGQRSPRADDLADVALGNVGAEISAGLTRPSRRVLDNNAARSKAAARRLVADEARKALAGVLVAEIELSYTARIPGDIVRVRRDGFDQPLIVSSMEWSADTRSITYQATCVPIVAYDFTGEFSADFREWRATS